MLVKTNATVQVVPSAPRPASLLRLVVGATVSRPATRCSICSVREVCLPCDLMQPSLRHTAEMVTTTRRIRQGARLFSAGDEFGYLYTVRSGFFKTVQNLQDGREQVTGFQMAGDMLGADAIASVVHGCDAVALEDSQVCAIAYSRIESLGRTMPELQHQLRKAMSNEIVREHGVMLLLGIMSAEERVAVFLLSLSQRFAARGYSPTEFILRMSRREIASYIGLTIETVSRSLSRLRNEGLISVKQRHIVIRDLPGLKRCIRQGSS